MSAFLSKRHWVKIRYQWQLFCLALMFFSQIPVAKNLPYSEKRMNSANRYFSLVGIVIGLLVALSFYLFDHFFSSDVAILLAMITSVFITGAFHEDGLADMADGMGGGYSPEKRLTIMKDSRIGTYGTVTLILSLLLKFQLLVELEQFSLFMISVVFAYAMSRAFAASLIFDTPYVVDDDSSKSKPIASQQSGRDLVILVAVAFIPSILFPWFFDDFWSLLVAIVVMLFLLRIAFRKWLMSKISGFTGDCLGAAQQVSELVIYLVMIAHLSNTGAF